jgi:hypothetical protein
MVCVRDAPADQVSGDSHENWWTGEDSNLRSPQGAADLQSAAISRSATRPESNQQLTGADSLHTVPFVPFLGLINHRFQRARLNRHTFNILVILQSKTPPQD